MSGLLGGVCESSAFSCAFALANGIAALVKTGRVEGWSLAAQPAIHRRIVDLPMASTLSAHCSSKNRWMREKEEGDFSRDSVEGREGGPVIIEAIGAGDLLGWPRMMPRVRVLG